MSVQMDAAGRFSSALVSEREVTAKRLFMSSSEPVCSLCMDVLQYLYSSNILFTFTAHLFLNSDNVVLSVVVNKQNLSVRNLIFIPYKPLLSMFNFLFATKMPIFGKHMSRAIVII